MNLFFAMIPKRFFGEEKVLFIKTVFERKTVSRAGLSFFQIV
jgi:hypothetical protein